MFFATTPVVVDGGAAGGDAGGDSGGSDAGTGDEGAAEGTDGGGSDESITTSDGDESGERDDLSESTEDAGERADESHDGRMLPDAVKKGLNKLRETDPKLAAELRKSHFEATDFKKVFRSPGDARLAKDTIEGLGGEEGIASIQKEVKDYATELSHFAQGNPQAIEDMARDFPQGLVKLTPHALDKMRGIDLPAYDRTIAKHMSATLKDKGVVSTIDRVLELIDDGKQVPAKEAVQRIKAWMQGVEQLGTSKPENEPDERSKEFEAREQTLQAKEQQLFDQRVATAVLADMDKVMTRHLQPFLKNRKLTSEQLIATKNDIRGRVSASLKTDTSYQERLKGHRASGDEAKTQAFINSNFAERAAKATAKVWALRGYAGTAAKRTATNGNGNQAITTSTKPPAEQIDWSKDSRRERYMAGEATLLPQFGGKVVRWQSW
jgi:hypothetical protein